MKNIDKYLLSYLSANQPYNKRERRYSSLVLALRDARYITNRNVDTGEITFQTEAALSPALWPGAITYLIILELIGTCFKLKNSPLASENAIYRALKAFSNISDNQARAIESLRHSFAHNYGLINIQKKNNGAVVLNRTHHFLLTNHPEGILIKERKQVWNGRLENRNKKNQTQINLWHLGTLVEETFRNLVQEVKRKHIELALADGLTELKAKYTVKI